MLTADKTQKDKPKQAQHGDPKPGSCVVVDKELFNKRLNRLKRATGYPLSIPTIRKVKEVKSDHKKHQNINRLNKITDKTNKIVSPDSSTSDGDHQKMVFVNNESVELRHRLQTSLHRRQLLFTLKHAEQEKEDAARGFRVSSNGVLVSTQNYDTYRKLGLDKTDITRLSYAKIIDEINSHALEENTQSNKRHEDSGDIEQESNDDEAESDSGEEEYDDDEEESGDDEEDSDDIEKDSNTRKDKSNLKEKKSYKDAAKNSFCGDVCYEKTFLKKQKSLETSTTNKGRHIFACEGDVSISTESSRMQTNFLKTKNYVFSPLMDMECYEHYSENTINSLSGGDVYKYKDSLEVYQEQGEHKDQKKNYTLKQQQHNDKILLHEQQETVKESQEMSYKENKLNATESNVTESLEKKEQCSKNKQIRHVIKYEGNSLKESHIMRSKQGNNASVEGNIRCQLVEKDRSISKSSPVVQEQEGCVITSLEDIEGRSVPHKIKYADGKVFHTKVEDTEGSLVQLTQDIFERKLLSKKLEDVDGKLLEKKLEDTEHRLIEQKLQDTEHRLIEQKLQDTEHRLIEQKLQDVEGMLIEQKLQDTEHRLIEQKLQDVEGMLIEQKLQDVDGMLIEQKLQDVEGMLIEQKLEGVEGMLIEQKLQDVDGMLIEQKLQDVEGMLIEQKLQDVEGMLIEQKLEGVEGMIIEQKLEGVEGRLIEQKLQDLEGRLIEQKLEGVEGRLIEQKLEDMRGRIIVRELDGTKERIMELKQEHMKGRIMEQKLENKEKRLIEQKIEDIKGRIIEQKEDMNGIREKRLEYIEGRKVEQEIEGRIVEQQKENIEGMLIEQKPEGAEWRFAHQKLKNIEGRQSKQKIEDKEIRLVKQKLEGAEGKQIEQELEEIEGRIVSYKQEGIEGRLVSKKLENIEERLVSSKQENIEERLVSSKQENIEGRLVSKKLENIEGRLVSKKQEEAEWVIVEGEHEHLKGGIVKNEIFDVEGDLVQEKLENFEDKRVKQIVGNEEDNLNNERLREERKHFVQNTDVIPLGKQSENISDHCEKTMLQQENDGVKEIQEQHIKSEEEGCEYEETVAPSSCYESSDMNLEEINPSKYDLSSDLLVFGSDRVNYRTTVSPYCKFEMLHEHLMKRLISSSDDSSDFQHFEECYEEDTDRSNDKNGEESVCKYEKEFGKEECEKTVSCGVSPIYDNVLGREEHINFRELKSSDDLDYLSQDNIPNDPSTDSEFCQHPQTEADICMSSDITTSDDDKPTSEEGGSITTEWKPQERTNDDSPNTALVTWQIGESFAADAKGRTNVLSSKDNTLRKQVTGKGSQYNLTREYRKYISQEVHLSQGQTLLSSKRQSSGQNNLESETGNSHENNGTGIEFHSSNTNNLEVPVKTRSSSRVHEDKTSHHVGYKNIRNTTLMNSIEQNVYEPRHKLVQLCEDETSNISQSVNFIGSDSRSYHYHGVATSSQIATPPLYIMQNDVDEQCCSRNYDLHEKCMLQTPHIFQKSVANSASMYDKYEIFPVSRQLSVSDSHPLTTHRNFTDLNESSHHHSLYPVYTNMEYHTGYIKYISSGSNVNESCVYSADNDIHGGTQSSVNMNIASLSNCSHKGTKTRNPSYTSSNLATQEHSDTVQSFKSNEVYGDKARSSDSNNSILAFDDCNHDQHMKTLLKSVDIDSHMECSSDFKSSGKYATKCDNSLSTYYIKKEPEASNGANNGIEHKQSAITCSELHSKGMEGVHSTVSSTHLTECEEYETEMILSLSHNPDVDHRKAEISSNVDMFAKSSLFDHEDCQEIKTKLHNKIKNETDLLEGIRCSNENCYERLMETESVDSEVCIVNPDILIQRHVSWGANCFNKTCTEINKVSKNEETSTITNKLLSIHQKTCKTMMTNVLRRASTNKTLREKKPTHSTKENVENNEKPPLFCMVTGSKITASKKTVQDKLKHTPAKRHTFDKARRTHNKQQVNSSYLANNCLTKSNSAQITATVHHPRHGTAHHVPNTASTSNINNVYTNKKLKPKCAVSQRNKLLMKTKTTKQTDKPLQNPADFNNRKCAQHFVNRNDDKTIFSTTSNENLRTHSVYIDSKQEKHNNLSSRFSQQESETKKPPNVATKQKSSEVKHVRENKNSNYHEIHERNKHAGVKTSQTSIPISTHCLHTSDVSGNNFVETSRCKDEDVCVSGSHRISSRKSDSTCITPNICSELSQSIIGSGDVKKPTSRTVSKQSDFNKYIMLHNSRSGNKSEQYYDGTVMPATSAYEEASVHYSTNNFCTHQQEQCLSDNNYLPESIAQKYNPCEQHHLICDPNMHDLLDQCSVQSEELDQYRQETFDFASQSCLDDFRKKQTYYINKNSKDCRNKYNTENINKNNTYTDKDCAADCIPDFETDEVNDLQTDDIDHYQTNDVNDFPSGNVNFYQRDNVNDCQSGSISFYPRDKVNDWQINNVNVCQTGNANDCQTGNVSCCPAYTASDHKTVSLNNHQIGSIFCHQNDPETHNFNLHPTDIINEISIENITESQINRDTEYHKDFSKHIKTDIGFTSSSMEAAAVCLTIPDYALGCKSFEKEGVPTRTNNVPLVNINHVTNDIMADNDCREFDKPTVVNETLRPVRNILSIQSHDDVTAISRKYRTTEILSSTVGLIQDRCELPEKNLLENDGTEPDDVNAAHLVQKPLKPDIITFRSMIKDILKQSDDLTTDVNEDKPSVVITNDRVKNNVLLLTASTEDNIRNCKKVTDQQSALKIYNNHKNNKSINDNQLHTLEQCAQGDFTANNQQQNSWKDVSESPRSTDPNYAQLKARALAKAYPVLSRIKVRNEKCNSSVAIEKFDDVSVKCSTQTNTPMQQYSQISSRKNNSNSETETPKGEKCILKTNDGDSCNGKLVLDSAASTLLSVGVKTANNENINNTKIIHNVNNNLMIADKCRNSISENSTLCGVDTIINSTTSQKVNIPPEARCTHQTRPTSNLVLIEKRRNQKCRIPVRKQPHGNMVLPKKFEMQHSCRKVVCETLKTQTNMAAMILNSKVVTKGEEAVTLSFFQRSANSKPGSAENHFCGLSQTVHACSRDNNISLEMCADSSVATDSTTNGETEESIRRPLSERIKKYQQERPRNILAGRGSKRDDESLLHSSRRSAIKSNNTSSASEISVSASSKRGRFHDDCEKIAPSSCVKTASRLENLAPLKLPNVEKVQMFAVDNVSEEKQDKNEGIIHLENVAVQTSDSTSASAFTVLDIHATVPKKDIAQQTNIPSENENCVSNNEKDVDIKMAVIQSKEDCCGSFNDNNIKTSESQHVGRCLEKSKITSRLPNQCIIIKPTSGSQLFKKALERQQRDNETHLRKRNVQSSRPSLNSQDRTAKNNLITNPKQHRYKRLERPSHNEQDREKTGTELMCECELFSSSSSDHDDEKLVNKDTQNESQECKAWNVSVDNIPKKSEKFLEHIESGTIDNIPAHINSIGHQLTSSISTIYDNVGVNNDVVCVEYRQESKLLLNQEKCLQRGDGNLQSDKTYTVGNICDNADSENTEIMSDLLSEQILTDSISDVHGTSRVYASEPSNHLYRQSIHERVDIRKTSPKNKTRHLSNTKHMELFTDDDERRLYEHVNRPQSASSKINVELSHYKEHLPGCYFLEHVNNTHNSNPLANYRDALSPNNYESLKNSDYNLPSVIAVNNHKEKYILNPIPATMSPRTSKKHGNVRGILSEKLAITSAESIMKSKSKINDERSENINNSVADGSKRPHTINTNQININNICSLASRRSLNDRHTSENVRIASKQFGGQIINHQSEMTSECCEKKPPNRPLTQCTQCPSDNSKPTRLSHSHCDTTAEKGSHAPICFLVASTGTLKSCNNLTLSSDAVNEDSVEMTSLLKTDTDRLIMENDVTSDRNRMLKYNLTDANQVVPYKMNIHNMANSMFKDFENTTPSSQKVSQNARASFDKYKLMTNPRKGKLTLATCEMRDFEMSSPLMPNPYESLSYCSSSKDNSPRIISCSSSKDNSPRIISFSSHEHLTCDQYMSEAENEQRLTTPTPAKNSTRSSKAIKETLKHSLPELSTRQSGLPHRPKFKRYY